MMRTVSMRVRFAPSPTGALHIGGARTALYNWLLARGQGGPTASRDARAAHRRYRPRAIDSRERRADPRRAALAEPRLGRGAGLPVRARRAPSRGARSSCSTTATRITRPRPPTTSRPTRSATASSAASAASPRSRARSGCASPTRARRSFDDIIRGEIRFPNASMDDPVIARADGSVLYNFAVAVDDLDAGITHVVRGEDHISNTPKQLLVFEALGRDAAALRAPAAAARAGRAQAVQAPRRRVGPGAARRRLSARGGRQLHRAAGRRVRRRRGVLHAGRARRALPPRARVQEPRGVRRAQAPAPERPLPARARRSTS